MTEKIVASQAIAQGAARVAEGFIMILNGYKEISRPVPGEFADALAALIERTPHGSDSQATEAPAPRNRFV
jgi:hypothetical protein